MSNCRPVENVELSTRRECRIVDPSRMSICLEYQSARISNHQLVENVELSTCQEGRIVNMSKMSNCRLVKNQTINGEYYKGVMDRLLKRIARISNSWFLLHDNTPT